MNFYFSLLVLLGYSYANANELPRNCESIKYLASRRAENITSGIFKIYPTASRNHAVEVFCDMETDDGGWIVIQRRQEADFQMDFYRNWAEYSSGFGLLHGSHWQGLDLVHTLTHMGNYKLRIDMMDWEGEKRFAEYAYFRVANSSDLYRLTVEGFSGDALDSLSRHSGKPFSTKDNDNDIRDDVNCAVKYHGAWWYDYCHESNLNGLYGSVDFGKGVIWATWHGFYYSLKRVEIKLRTY